MARRGLVACLSDISDPRMDRTKKHLLIDILVVTVCAYVSGADNWIEVVEWAKSREEWLRKFLELPNGIPSHDTFGRVFALIEPKEFEKAFQAWVTELRQALQVDGVRDVVSIDGKKLRATFHYSNHCTSAIGIVSAWSSETGLVLGQRRYDYSGEHEKWVMRDVVDLLHLKGCVVTLDAAGATKEIFEKVIEKKADFVIGLKKNFKGLYKIADEIFTTAYPHNKKRLTRTLTAGKEHGRNEKRIYELIEVKEAEFWRSKSRQEYLEPLAYIKSIGRVTSLREKNGEVSEEVRYYMSTLETHEHKDFAYAIRSHWKIENQLHWVLDVAFREDQARVRMKNAGENVAVIRRLALNLLKQDQTNKIGIQAKRRKAGWDTGYIEKILTQADF